jgi:hypothetical protein
MPLVSHLKGQPDPEHLAAAERPIMPLVHKMALQNAGAGEIDPCFVNTDGCEQAVLHQMTQTATIHHLYYLNHSLPIQL